MPYSMSHPIRTLASLAAVFLLGAALSAPAAAQSRFSQNRLSLGLKGGVNQSTFIGDDVDDADYRAGFSGGVYLNYAINPLISIQPEVLYDRYGADAATFETTGVPGATAGGTDYESSYLSVPVLLKVRPPVRWAIQPALMAGPSVRFLLDGEANGASIDGSMEDVDFGLVVGGEIGLNLARLGLDTGRVRRLFFSPRYTFGLSQPFDAAGDPDVYNGGFTGAVGIEIAL